MVNSGPSRKGHHSPYAFFRISVRAHPYGAPNVRLSWGTPQTYDTKLLDKKSWVKNHPFWDSNLRPYVRNPFEDLKKFLGQPSIWRFLNSRLGCTGIEDSYAEEAFSFFPSSIAKVQAMQLRVVNIGDTEGGSN